MPANRRVFAWLPYRLMRVHRSIRFPMTPRTLRFPAISRYQPVGAVMIEEVMQVTAFLPPAPMSVALSESRHAGRHNSACHNYWFRGYLSIYAPSGSG